MAHEELKKQYEEDKKNYGFNAYKLWEFEDDIVSKWINCDSNGPRWFPEINYRRKEDSFQPEYFSGLNWRDALNYLEHKLVEVSHDGQTWHGPFKLRMISSSTFCFQAASAWWTYIRTCPETFVDQHPTIKITVNGKDYHLPKPETYALEKGTNYYAIDPMEVNCIEYETWEGDCYDNARLINKAVHLTEARAQAWADFWKEIHK